eukprot:scaffold196599_cov30-Tisochrysis_lutea.AAC.3
MRAPRRRLATQSHACNRDTRDRYTRIGAGNSCQLFLPLSSCGMPGQHGLALARTLASHQTE